MRVTVCSPQHGCFGGIDLTNVNFTGANLTGADFYYPSETGITWSNTTCPDGTNSDTNGTSPSSCTGHGGGL
jgi:uncharacterized protein YjbI with pentapeptide repeats